MKIIIAPDSFKESLSSIAAADAIERGWKEIFPTADCVKLPVADGGEGTVEALTFATGGRLRTIVATDPLGRPVDAVYGCNSAEDTAFIEMAAASGLMLVAPEERNPLLTGSYGTGELIADALNRGFSHLVVGIGGSATNDGGAGMLQALGVRLLDARGRELAPGGAALADLAHIDSSRIHPRLAECRLELACDVDNPLCGERGASAVFGPQKGATPEMVAQLDANLAHFAAVIRRDLGRDVAGIPGAGAAGGMGAALLAFCNARPRPGIEIVLETINLQQHLHGAELVITGEGRIDAQTAYGKTPVGVARSAQAAGVPVIALAGSIGAGVEAVHQHGIDALFSITPSPCTLTQALADAATNLQRTTRNIAAICRLRGSSAQRHNIIPH